MPRTTNDGRHLSISNLTALWASDTPVVVTVQGEPPCRVRIDPAEGEVALITPYAIPEPEVGRLRNVTLSTVTTGDQSELEITVSTTDNFHSAYSFLTAIADQLQQQRAPLVTAVATAVASHREVLAPRGALNLEREVGLYGELLVVEHLVAHAGAADAIAAWKGPIDEEHDFVLPDCDLEIKTTSSDRRQHVISSLTQLEPRPSSVLYLVSIQITRTTASTGRTLARLVADVRSSCSDHATHLDRCLDGAGWNANDADVYATHWTLRSTPTAYLIEDGFPRLTPAHIRQVVNRADVVSDVSFRIDVTNIDPAVLPVLNGFGSDREDPE